MVTVCKVDIYIPANSAHRTIRHGLPVVITALVVAFNVVLRYPTRPAIER